MKTFIITSTIFFTFLVSPFLSIDNNRGFSYTNTSQVANEFTNGPEDTNDHCKQLRLLITWAPLTSESKKKQLRASYYKYGLSPFNILKDGNTELWTFNFTPPLNNSGNPFYICDKPEDADLPVELEPIVEFVEVIG